MVGYTKCSDYASESCPCKLAETNNCIVCSMCGGDDFCSCNDTEGFCVLKELSDNGGKAKSIKKSWSCKVLSVKHWDIDCLFVTVRVSENCVMNSRLLGTFVFVRIEDHTYFDFPVSVLCYDDREGTLGFVISAKGVKTDKFRQLKEGDTIWVRGPYFNGIFGKKDISLVSYGKCVLISRGIGILPVFHVYNELKRHHNEVELYFEDPSPGKQLSKHLFSLYDIPFKNITICNDSGSLADEVLRLVNQSIHDDISLIHFGLSDYLLKKVIHESELDDISKTIISFNNNAIMCCGEGICGACTRNSDTKEVIHLCKEQIDVYDYVRML